MGGGHKISFWLRFPNWGAGPPRRRGQTTPDSGLVHLIHGWSVRRESRPPVHAWRPCLARAACLVTRPARGVRRLGRQVTSGHHAALIPHWEGRSQGAALQVYGVRIHHKAAGAKVHAPAASTSVGLMQPVRPVRPWGRPGRRPNRGAVAKDRGGALLGLKRPGSPAFHAHTEAEVMAVGRPLRSLRRCSVGGARSRLSPHWPVLHRLWVPLEEDPCQ